MHTLLSLLTALNYLINSIQVVVRTIDVSLEVCLQIMYLFELLDSEPLGYEKFIACLK